MWFVYILLGAISVVTAILILRHELKKAILAIPKMPSGESFKKELDEVNSSFFEIANDLEGKYSIHEKQILDLEERMVKLFSEQAKLMNASSGRSAQAVVPAQSTNPSLQNSVENGAAPRRRSTDRVEQETRLAGDVSGSTYATASRSVRLERTRQSDYAIARDAKAMLDRGMALPEVAKQLGIGIGELKLILGINMAR